MVAVESSASNAMHSEMDRRGGIGAWITTGSLPLSITTSAPARTRASSPQSCNHHVSVEHVRSRHLSMILHLQYH
jgi:hypothetical protein